MPDTQTDTQTHTHTQTKYHNPRACAPKVNDKAMNYTVYIHVHVDKAIWQSHIILYVYTCTCRYIYTYRYVVFIQCVFVCLSLSHNCHTLQRELEIGDHAPYLLPRKTFSQSEVEETQYLSDILQGSGHTNITAQVNAR